MNLLRSSFLLLLLFIVSISGLFGKGYPVLQYTVENGLPSNTVYDVCRDRQGNVWLATDKGVARFNGISFDVFTTEDGLPDNEVFGIFEDRQERLWLVNYNGKLCYYEHGRFYSGANARFLELPFKLSMPVRLDIGADSSITYCFDYQDYFVNIKNYRTRVYSLAGLNLLYPGRSIRAIIKNSPGTFDIFYAKRRVTVDTQMRILKTIVYKEDRPFQKPSGDSCYATQKGVYSASGKLLRKLPGNFWKSNALLDVYADSNNCFLATYSGLLINEGPLFEKTPLTHMGVDGNGNYIICTLGKGFYVLSHEFKNTGYSEHAYTGIAKYASASNGYLYIVNHNKSLFRLRNGMGKRIVDAIPFVDTNETAAFHKTACLIRDNTYYAIGQGGSFIASQIDRDPVVKQINLSRNHFFRKDLLAAPYIYFTGAKDIYATTLDDLRKHGEPKLKILKDPDAGVSNISTVAQAPDGSVWYSRREHVYKLKDTQIRLQRQFRDIVFRETLIAGRFLVGYTHANNLLICKDYDGSMQIDSVKGQSCVWEKMYRLDERHILISTDNLYRILTLPDTNANSQYSIRTLGNPYVPLRAEYICADSLNCYFMKDGSATWFPLAMLLREMQPPIVTFTGLEARNKSLSDRHDAVLSYKDAQYITVHFATPSFYRITECEYAISHPGEPDAWQPVEGRTISLYNLSYGQYNLKLRARSVGGIYSQPVVIAITVLHPYWAKGWFLALVTLAAVLLAALVIRYYVRWTVTRKEAAYKNELRFLRAEYKSMNALMNPHFIFNAMNSVQSLINTSDKTSASEYLRTFADLIRHNMHHISHELVTLEQEMNITENYLQLEQLRFDHRLHYQIEIDDTVDLDDILVPPLLIQPLVENAVKHGLFRKSGIEDTITIRIFPENGMLLIEVEDNGTGFTNTRQQRNHSHVSFGTSNIRTRLEQLTQLHNRRILFEITELKDGEGNVSGTRATIKLEMEY